MSRHQRFHEAVRHHWLDFASPVTQGFAGARKADGLLVDAQGFERRTTWPEAASRLRFCRRGRIWQRGFCWLQQVRDVLRACARGTRCGEGRVQSASGKRGRRGVQLRVTVGLHAQGGGGKELLGLRQVLALLDGKHG